MFRRRTAPEIPPRIPAELARFDEARQRLAVNRDLIASEIFDGLRAGLAQALEQRSILRLRLGELEDSASAVLDLAMAQVLNQLEAVEYVIEHAMVDVETFVAQATALSMVEGVDPILLERQIVRLQRDIKALNQVVDS